MDDHRIIGIPLHNLPDAIRSIKSTSRLLAFYLFAATEFYSVISYPILYLYPIFFYIFLHFFIVCLTGRDCDDTLSNLCRIEVLIIKIEQGHY